MEQIDDVRVEQERSKHKMYKSVDNANEKCNMGRKNCGKKEKNVMDVWSVLKTKTEGYMERL